MIVEKNTTSIQGQLDAANDHADRKKRRNEAVSGLIPRKVKVGVVAAAAVLGTAYVDHLASTVNEKNERTTQVGFTEAPHQTTPSQISTNETSPSTTMVSIGEGQGPYQVVSDAVKAGIVSPEDAPAAQADVLEQYNASGGKHPNDQVSVQVSPKQ